MVKITVLIDKIQFFIFDLENDLLVQVMISRVQFNNFNLMTWFKTLQVHWIDKWILQLIDQKLIVYEKSNFDFLVKFKCQRSQFIKACQNMKLIHQEIKNSKFHLEKLKFLNLEIFLSVGNFLFFHNFKKNFHHDARWFKRNFQHEICRSPLSLQLCFTQLLPKVLGSQVIILRIHGHETKHLVKFLP